MHYTNRLREALVAGKFLYTLEYVPDIKSAGTRALDELARNASMVGSDPRIFGVNIGDRVKSLDSFSTVECGRVAADASGKVPLLHLAGKDRTASDARAVIDSAFRLGLENVLLVSGDGIVVEERPERIRYHESVAAIADAKDLNANCTVAAAISPFKYREEELLNQYLKMVKKIRTGADYLITNCGWDMRKFQELIWYRNARGFSTPIVANLLLPSFVWARGIHARRLPGVYMSDDLFERIQREHQGGKAASRPIFKRRLALQIIGVKLLGYAGVHLSGVETYEALAEVIDEVESLEAKYSSYEDWLADWEVVNSRQDGKPATFGPDNGLYLFDREPEQNSLSGPPILSGVRPSDDEIAKYDEMRVLHERYFAEGSISARIFSSVVRVAGTTGPTRSALLSIEHRLKETALGCESCGFCRIEYLSYVCPETCPKGLANGPCAGTDANTCEFRDRECIHNKKYRLAKRNGNLADLESVFVPPVDTTRGTSSWLNYFAKSGPSVRRLA